MEEFADDKLNIAEIIISAYDRLEKHFEKTFSEGFFYWLV